MKFIGTALMAIVALTSSTEAARYPGISNDCRNRNWEITMYSGPNCTGASQVMKIGKPGKCDNAGPVSIKYNCNAEELEIYLNKGPNCTGGRIRTPPIGAQFPTSRNMVEFTYDECHPWDYRNKGGQSFRIHPKK